MSKPSLFLFFYILKIKKNLFLKISLKLKKSMKKNYNNSFLKSIVSFKSGPVEMMVTGTPVSV